MEERLFELERRLSTGQEKTHKLFEKDKKEQKNIISKIMS
jgi:hypothetical protein